MGSRCYTDFGNVCFRYLVLGMTFFRVVLWNGLLFSTSIRKYGIGTFGISFCPKSQLSTRSIERLSTASCEH